MPYQDTYNRKFSDIDFGEHEELQSYFKYIDDYFRGQQSYTMRAMNDLKMRYRWIVSYILQHYASKYTDLKEGDNRDFTKINKLYEIGIIDITWEQTLHAARKIGNDGAHRGNTKSVQDMMFTYQHLLNEVGLFLHEFPYSLNPGLSQQEDIGKKQGNKWEINGRAIKGFFALAAVIVFLIAIRMVYVRMPVTVSLNEFVTITVSGYDGEGTAAYEFDEEKFLSYCASKIRGNSQKTAAASWILENCIDGGLDNTENLSNGDEVTYSWDVDNKAARKNYKVKLEFSDITYTVSGLTELDEVDAFAGISLEFYNTAPNGMVKLENNSEEQGIQEIYFTITPSEGLSNGDTVTVSIAEDSINMLESQYNLVPAEMSKEYTVSGLDSYITSLDMLSKENIESCMEETETYISSEVSSMGDGITIESMDFLGCYNFVPESDSGLYYLYVVYKITIHEYREKTGIDNTFSYFTYAEYCNAIVDGNGTISLTDYSNGRLPSEQIQHTLDWYDSSDVVLLYTETFTYNGYNGLDDLYNDCVSKQSDNHTYESSVED